MEQTNKQTSYVCLDVDDDDSTTITLTIVLATQNLLALLHTTTC
jgi:hypothetical protein